MRLGFDAKRVFHNSTGLGHYSRNLLLALNRYYPYAHYLLFTPRRDKVNFDHSGFEKVYPDGGWDFTWRSWGIVRQIKKLQVDIFHGLSNEIPFTAPSAGVKTVVTIHDIIYKKYPSAYGFFDRSVYDRKTGFAVNHADRVVASSQSTLSDLEEVYGLDTSKGRVVYPPLNPIFYNTEPGEEIHSSVQIPSEFLLFVGAGNERKNLEMLISMQEATPKGSRIPVVVVGGGSAYAKQCRKRIVQQKLDEDFLFLEACNDLQLKWLYQHAVALLYPSRYEGFGMPVTEALLCGCPVIVSNNSSLPEAGGDAALYASTYDPQEWITLLNTILDSGEWKDGFTQRAAQHTRSFSHEVIAGQMMDVYNELNDPSAFTHGTS